jgi:hypothetical protein
MTLNRLRQIAETYGADPRRWPAAERASLEPLIGRLPAARSMLRDEQNLDQLLDGWRLESPDWALERRILATAAMTAQVRAAKPWQKIIGWVETIWPGEQLPRGRQLWPQVAGLAAAAMIGFFVGISDLGAFDTAGAGNLDEALTGISAVGNWE